MVFCMYIVYAKEQKSVNTDLNLNNQYGKSADALWDLKRNGR